MLTSRKVIHIKLGLLLLKDKGSHMLISRKVKFNIKMG